MADISPSPIAFKISDNIHKNISNQSVNSLFSHTPLFGLAFNISV
jgi:hypothetical protein